MEGLAEENSVVTLVIRKGLWESRKEGRKKRRARGSKFQAANLNFEVGKNRPSFESEIAKEAVVGFKTGRSPWVVGAEGHGLSWCLAWPVTEEEERMHLE